MDVAEALVALAGHAGKHRVPAPFPRHEVAALARDPRIVEVEAAMVALAGKADPVDHRRTAFRKVRLRRVRIPPVTHAVLADQLAGEGQLARTGDLEFNVRLHEQ